MQNHTISVGDIVESELLAFEIDIHTALNKFDENEYWWFEQDATFYDFENDGCPWSMWIVVAKKDNMFLIVPCTGDNESKLVNNDHPDHCSLPNPVKVQCKWIYYDTSIEEIYALAGHSQWRSEEEMKALNFDAMRNLLSGEAEKIRRAVFAN